jgi:hypothetical protein
VKRKDKQKSIKNLETLRNVGKKTAERLYSICIRTPEQMKNSNPQQLYDKLKKKCGGKLDRCVLYQFRGAKLNKPWWECKADNKK